MQTPKSEKKSDWWSFFALHLSRPISLDSSFHREKINWICLLMMDRPMAVRESGVSNKIVSFSFHRLRWNFSARLFRSPSSASEWGDKSSSGIYLKFRVLCRKINTPASQWICCLARPHHNSSHRKQLLTGAFIDKNEASPWNGFLVKFTNHGF